LVIILFVILTNRGVPESLDPLSTIVQLYRGSQFCKVKSSDVSKDLKAHMTRNGSKFEFEGSTIIYCPTKKATMETAAICMTHF
jgi:hypothetical protein